MEVAHTKKGWERSNAVRGSGGQGRAVVGRAGQWWAVQCGAVVGSAGQGSGGQGNEIRRADVCVCRLEQTT